VSEVFPGSPPPALPPLPPRWAQAPEPLPDPLDGLGLPPVTATPGQAAYEARYRNYAVDEDWSPPPWPDLADEERADWEAAAAAVMLMAQATVDYAELRELREAKAPDRLAKAVTALRADIAGLTVARDCLGKELSDARTAFAKLAGHFTQGRQSGWTARISGSMLRRLCVAAMCEPPPGTGLEALAEASELVAERDALQRQLDARNRQVAELQTPEVAGIIAGRANARAVVAEMTGRFGATAGSDWVACTTAGQLARWRKRAGVDGDGG
jgi:hypothetical protein